MNTNLNLGMDVMKRHNLYFALPDNQQDDNYDKKYDGCNRAVRRHLTPRHPTRHNSERSSVVAGGATCVGK